MFVNYGNTIEDAKVQCNRLQDLSVTAWTSETAELFELIQECLRWKPFSKLHALKQVLELRDWSHTFFSMSEFRFTFTWNKLNSSGWRILCNPSVVDVKCSELLVPYSENHQHCYWNVRVIQIKCSTSIYYMKSAFKEAITYLVLVNLLILVTPEFLKRSQHL